MTITASAPAKTILFGEHAVVYGEPAIAIPLPNIRTYAELQPNGQEFRVISSNAALDHTYEQLESQKGLRLLLDLLMHEFNIHELPMDTLTIRSNIPIASGLGSGAALSAAVARAFALRYGIDLKTERLNRITYEIEKVYHGTPSGIDNTTVTYEQPIFFIKGNGFTTLTADLSHYDLLIIDSGIRSRTVDVVSDVRAHLEQNEPAIRRIGDLVKEAKTTLEQGDPQLVGQLMNENQNLLREINVSSVELDDLIEIGLSAGALGAKLTGAGRGGNIIVLAQTPAHALQIKSLYESKGFHVIL